MFQDVVCGINYLFKRSNKDQIDLITDEPLYNTIQIIKYKGLISTFDCIHYTINCFIIHFSNQIRNVYILYDRIIKLSLLHKIFIHIPSKVF